jgi:DNA-binding NarL/FixJ family response regulator
MNSATCENSQCFSRRFALGYDRSTFLCAGAGGYLLKKTPRPDCSKVCRKPSPGGAPMSPEVARASSNCYAKSTPERANYDLRPHELPLLKLLAEGHNYKAAATGLHVTTTIYFHLQNIYAKLKVHSKTEAVVKALRKRLI